MGFFLRKFLTQWFYPLPAALLLVIAGLVLSRSFRYRPWGTILCWVGVALVFAAGCSWVANALLAPLENRAAGELRADPAYIVVLGGGASSHRTRPASSQLHHASLSRLVEGVVRYRRFPGSKLVLCGGPVFDTRSEAEIMQELALELGVKRGDIILETSSLTTADQARIAPRFVGKRPFLLVTCASHMPRALHLFRRQGLEPVAAPTHYLTVGHRRRPWALLPNGNNLIKVRRAVHEYGAFVLLTLAEWAGWGRKPPRRE